MLACLITILLMCVFTFILFVHDKYCAQKGDWRVPEFVLLFMAAAGGAMGALLAMYLYHHKTQKVQFANGVPLMILVQTLLLIVTANIFL